MHPLFKMPSNLVERFAESFTHYTQIMEMNALILSISRLLQQKERRFYPPSDTPICSKCNQIKN